MVLSVNIKGKVKMDRVKINFKFDCFTLQRISIMNIMRKCIQKTLDEETVPVGCEVNVLLTNDMGIQAINKAVRNIDKPTDVLSFPMFDFTPGDLPEDWSDYIDPDTQMCPVGDIAISIERASSQAKEYGHSFRREIGYLTIHSVLHLLGYDHMDEGEEKRQMRNREESIASKIGGLER